MLVFFERRGWIMLALLAATIVLFGQGDVRQGLPADPAIPFGLTGKTLAQLRAESPDAYEVADFGVKGGGLNLIVIGLLLLAILLTAYRTGERWSWWAMWLLPLWGLSASIAMFLAEREPGTPPPPPMVSGPIFFAVCAIVLLLSVRRYLPAADRSVVASERVTP